MVVATPRSSKSARFRKIPLGNLKATLGDQLKAKVMYAEQSLAAHFASGSGADFRHKRDVDQVTSSARPGVHLMAASVSPNALTSASRFKLQA